MSQQSAVTLNYFDVKSVLGTVRVATESGLYEMVHLCKFKTLNDLPRAVLSVTNRHTGQYENLYLIHLDAAPAADINIQHAIKELFLPALLRHEVFATNFADNGHQFTMRAAGSSLEQQIRSTESFFSYQDHSIENLLTGDMNVAADGTKTIRIATTDPKSQYGNVNMLYAALASAKVDEHPSMRSEGVRFTATVKHTEAAGNEVSTDMHGFVGQQIGSNIRKFFRTPEEAATFLAGLFMSKFPFLDVSIRFED